LNPEIHSIDQEVYIHGDFHLSNVLYSLSEDVAYIVDFAPPGFSQSKSYCYGSIYDDLAWMIILIEVKYPPHRVYLLARKNNKKLSKSFIKGYEDAIGMRVDQRRLATYLEKGLTQRIENVQRKNVLSRLFWTWQFKRAINAYGCRKQ
jgi:Ser/Thr protein kinase RdoA (MazF antagonist)